MCGIGGLVGRLVADEGEPAARRMQAALRHRGPDDAGLFKTDGAIFIHQRLAILDPSPLGRQPMTRGPLTLTFNGEIYNYRELRAELACAGETFITGTDTEVILAFYAREGPRCLRRLRGMFALAIWDARDQSCFLARDAFGIKPLYHATLRDGTLVFASELRAILATRLVERRIEPRGLRGFLATGSVPEPWTIAAGVRLLEAGTWLRWRDGAMQSGRHSSFGAGENEDEAARGPDLRSALADSIRHHLVSDVPVGLLLSGGLDSGALLALMRENHDGPIDAFSVSVEDPRINEGEAARTIARRFGARHRCLLLTEELARHWLEDFFASVDQPTLDGFNTYCACKLARDFGCKVVLSGLGADELLGGYPSFRHLPWMRATARVLRGLGAGRLARLLRVAPAPARVGRLLDYLAGSPTLTRAHEGFRGLFTTREIATIGRALFPGHQLSLEDDFPEDTGGVPVAQAISELELSRYLRNQLLRDADVMSMAHGVELRVPWLDPALYAALLRLPPCRRFAPNKNLLREAVPEMPSATDRRKRGFDLPFATWLRRDWADLADTPPKLSGIDLRPWSRSWALIVLQRWLRRHELA